MQKWHSCLHRALYHLLSHNHVECGWSTTVRVKNPQEQNLDEQAVLAIWRTWRPVGGVSLGLVYCGCFPEEMRLSVYRWGCLREWLHCTLACNRIYILWCNSMCLTQTQSLALSPPQRMMGFPPILESHCDYGREHMVSFVRASR